MKRLIILIAFSLMAILYASQSKGCTNFLITKGASTSGHTMISYSADAHTLYGGLYHFAAATYPAGTMMDVWEWDTGKYLGKIKQALQTYNVVGNMNEFQVAIGETTFGGREELYDSTAIMDYGSLIYITLQRAKTAREAIKIMTDLVNEYGYASSGESFSIADPNEVWVMEMISKGKPEWVKDKKTKKMVNVNKGAVWVAIRIPDGYISGHANHARITTIPFNDKENCIYAADVVSFAKKMGWFNGQDKDFSFSDTYAPLDFGAARFCEARVWSGFNKVSKEMAQYADYAQGKNLAHRMPLYIKPDYKLSLEDVYGLMRDYYQNTDMDMTKDIGAGPYSCIVRWRPMTWKVDGNSYFHERAISTQQTGFVFVSESRSEIPAPLGGIIWFGVDDTYTTVFSPMYTCMTRIPQCFADADIMDFNENAAFWVFNQVSNLAYTRYSDMIKDIQPKQKELEQSYIAQIAQIDAQAQSLYAQDPQKAIAYLTDYSVKAGENTVKEWKKLYGFLFAKYLDGNIKTKVKVPEGYKYHAPEVKQPGYSDAFKRMIIKETGDKFKVPEGQSSH